MTKKILLAVLIFIIIPVAANAKPDHKKPIYSEVSTSFILSKTVKCNKIKAKFEIYAEGDTYNMALNRVTKINNDFINFLKTMLTPKEIQTNNSYGYSKTAIIYVSIDSKKISTLPKILKYIANKKFQYKTGIKPVYIRFTVSNDLRSKVKNELFLEALNAAKEKLAIVNKALFGGYKINFINIETNSFYPVLYERNTFRTLYKSMSKTPQGSNIQTSPGSITIKVKVRLRMIKKIH